MLRVPLAGVEIVHVDPGAQKDHEPPLHGGGLAHLGTGVYLQRDHIRKHLLEVAGGIEELLPAAGLPADTGPRGDDPRLLEDVLAVEDHPNVGPEREAVDLAFVSQDLPHAGRDVLPILPLPDLGPHDLIQGFHEPSRVELGDPESVEPHDVRAATDLEVQGILLFEGLIGAAELDELHLHVLALFLHPLLEGGEDHVLQPLDQEGVNAAADGARGDGELDGLRGKPKPHEGCRQNPYQKASQKPAHNSNTSLRYLLSWGFPSLRFLPCSHLLPCGAAA